MSKHPSDPTRVTVEVSCFMAIPFEGGLLHCVNRGGLKNGVRKFTPFGGKAQAPQDAASQKFLQSIDARFPIGEKELWVNIPRQHLQEFEAWHANREVHASAEDAVREFVEEIGNEWNLTKGVTENDIEVVQHLCTHRGHHGFTGEKVERIAEFFVPTFTPEYTASLATALEAQQQRMFTGQETVAVLSAEEMVHRRSHCGADVPAFCELPLHKLPALSQQMPIAAKPVNLAPFADEAGSEPEHLIASPLWEAAPALAVA